MPFQKKPDTEKYRHQVSTTLSKDTNERWHLICMTTEKSSHSLLRQLVEDYCRQNDPTRDPYTVLGALRR